MATPAIAAAAAGATVLVGLACVLAAAAVALGCRWAHWSKHARRASLSLVRLLHCCQPGGLADAPGAVCALLLEGASRPVASASPAACATRNCVLGCFLRCSMCL